tara:strand:+ start:171 stop:488 length:318 start_codon:yes stop_codon:yes gene_type:complete
LVTNLQSEGWLGRTANFNIDVQDCFPGAVVVQGECRIACWKALMQAQTVMQLVWSEMCDTENADMSNGFLLELFPLHFDRRQHLQFLALSFPSDLHWTAAATPII